MWCRFTDLLENCKLDLMVISSNLKRQIEVCISSKEAEGHGAKGAEKETPKIGADMADCLELQDNVKIRHREPDSIRITRSP